MWVLSEVREKVCDFQKLPLDKSHFITEVTELAKRQTIIPQYGTVMKRGVLYYRTRIKDANGKLVWREVAADAVGKGVCVYTQRLYEGYDKLYYKTSGRDVYGRSDR